MPGTLNLKACTGLIELLRSFDREKKYIAAICAAPSILAELGMLKGRKACSYPSFEGKLDGADVVREPAVTDGHITTGRGMGTAIPLCAQADSAAGRRSEGRGDKRVSRLWRIAGENAINAINTKNTGNMRMRVLYCVNDCKCLFLRKEILFCAFKEEENEFTGRKIRT